MSQNLWLKQKTFVAYALMLLALTEMIDLSIIAVALPQIMGAVGANIEQIAAITTSYIIMVVIFTPITGMCVRKYGIKRVVIFATILFGTASMLCGLATTLAQIILFRIVQGIGGAFFTPIAQSYLDQNFDEEEKPKVMLVYSCCVVVGPILGPVLGGLLTAYLSWRWCFFSNIPLCIISLCIISLFLSNQKTEIFKIDYLSFIFMALGLGFLEYFLEKGGEHNWFDSSSIVMIFSISLLFMTFFIWRGFLGKSVINFELFTQKNFMLISMITFVMTFLFVSVIAYIPTMLQTVYGYPVNIAAYLTTPLGISAMLAAPLILKLSKKIDVRVIAFFSVILLAIFSLGASTLNQSINTEFIIGIGILEGVGIIGLFIPMMAVLFFKLPKHLQNDASGFFNLLRLLANSLAASFAAYIIAHSQQTSFHDLVAHVSPYARGYQVWEQKLGLLPQTIKAMLAQDLILKQSYLIGFLDLFYICGISMLLLSWIVFLVKAPKPSDNISVSLE